MLPKWTRRPHLVSHSAYKGDQNAPFSLMNGAQKLQDISNLRKQVYMV